MQINMEEYLPKIINGVTDLLIKLAEPCWSLEKIKSYMPSEFHPRRLNS